MTINAKEFYIAVKNGIGKKEFMKSFGISTPELLEDLANKFLGGKESRRILAALDKNDKRRSKAIRAEAKPIAETEISESDTKTIAETQISESDVQSDIEAIANKIKELSSSIINLEFQHNKYVQSNLEEKNKLCKIQKSLKELQEEIERKKEDFENVEIVISNNYSDMAKINSQLQQLRTEKALLEEKYEKLKRITIFIFSSDIACEGFEIPDFSKEKMQEVLSRFFSLPNITDFNIALNELTTLCKLELLVDDIKSKELKSELIFDKPEMQRLFETL